MRGTWGGVPPTFSSLYNRIIYSTIPTTATTPVTVSRSKGDHDEPSLTVMAACRASGAAWEVPEPIIKEPIRKGSRLAE